MIKCVIFDCDGTLVDSEYLCNLGLEIKFREYGIEIPAKELMDKFRGGNLSETLQIIQAEYGITVKDDFVGSYRSMVSDLFEKGLRTCEGVGEMLASLALPKCVASNGPPEKIREALSITGIDHHFGQNIFSAYEVGAWKPDPGVFLHAAKKMGYHPGNCAVVEDTLVGISAAKAAGMFPILYDPEDTHGSLEGVNRIQHMYELLRIVAIPAKPSAIPV